MDRNRITINDNGIAHIPDGEIWMSELELIELFHTIVPTLRAAVRAVFKSGVCDIGTDHRTEITPEGYRLDCYNLSMITALAFRINTAGAKAVRDALLERMMSRRKEEINLFLSLGMKEVRTPTGMA